MRTAMSFFPALRPFFMRQQARRSTMGEEGRMVAGAGDVVHEGNVADLDVVEGPLSEELDLGGVVEGLVLLLLGLLLLGLLDLLGLLLVHGFFDVGHGYYGWVGRRS